VGYPTGPYAQRQRPARLALSPALSPEPMPANPALAILVVTYQRADVLRDTLKALADHLAYNGDVTIIVADGRKQMTPLDIIAYAAAILVATLILSLTAMTIIAIVIESRKRWQ
jgi:hypothetical protein